jgi:hypothetical protein
VSTEFSRAGKSTRNFAQSETVDLLIELVGREGTSNEILGISRKEYQTTLGEPDIAPD